MYEPKVMPWKVFGSQSRPSSPSVSLMMAATLVSNHARSSSSTSRSQKTRDASCTHSRTRPSVSSHLEVRICSMPCMTLEMSRRLKV